MDCGTRVLELVTRIMGAKSKTDDMVGCKVENCVDIAYGF